MSKAKKPGPTPSVADEMLDGLKNFNAKLRSGKPVKGTRVRAWYEKNKPTLQELGLKMGFAEAQAKQAVFQFLKSKNPRIDTLRRFAKASGVPVEELIAEGKPAKAKRLVK